MSAAKQEPHVGAAQNQGTILVVEDDVLVQRALLRLLRTTGYDAEAFGSVEEFFARPLPQTPVCLLLDLHLPGGNGIEILDRLIEAGDDVPAIILTGHGDVSSAVRAMKRGAIEFLEKPLDRQELLASIEAGMAQAHAAADRRREQREVRDRLKMLTPRERQVLEHVVAGWANKRIAGELGVAEQTIKVHRGRVMEKMAAASLADLVRLAAVAGIHGVDRS